MRKVFFVLALLGAASFVGGCSLFNNCNSCCDKSCNAVYESPCCGGASGGIGWSGGSDGGGKSCGGGSCGSSCGG